MPRIDKLLDTIGQVHYCQVPMKEEDQTKTAFASLFQFTVMPSSLCGAATTFQCLMDTVL